MLRTMNKFFFEKIFLVVFILLFILFGIIDCFYFEHYFSKVDFYVVSILFIALFFYNLKLLRTEVLKQTEDQLKLKEYYEFLNQAPISILVTDKDGYIKYANPCASKSTGYSLTEIIGKHTKIFKSGFTDPSVYESLWQTILSGNIWHGTLQNRKKNGSLRWEQVTISPISTIDGDIEFLAIKEDVDYKKSIQTKLEYQATHDHLTGLYNWNYFESILSNITTSENNSISAFLIYLDFDEFKIVTDSVGFSGGNEFLRQATTLIKNQIRGVDSFGRLSGDDFIILLEDTNQKDALNLCSRITKSVESWRFLWENKIFKTTVSMGLIKVEKDIAVEQLLKQADQMCSLAKERGNNHVAIYDSDELQRIEKTLNIIVKIRNALDNNSFMLFAQPIKGFIDEKPFYEILVRMIESENLLLPPGVFIPAAERYQLIQEIDKWVVKNTFDFIRNQQNACDCKFSINLSGKSINQEMVGFILLESYDIKKSNILFEITETASVQNFSTSNQFITILTDAGFNFGLDDFGSGMSSFGYLKQMSVDFVKIDGAFVRGIVNDQLDCQIVKAICKILQKMNKKIIAEFVESEEIYEACKKIGVHYVQGYHIGKPLPLTCVFCEKSFCNSICELYPKPEDFKLTS